jgi:hypothetical protein
LYRSPEASPSRSTTDVEREDIAAELGIKDTAVPMYLHVFEYLVHGAIVKWWKRLTSRGRGRPGLRAKSSRGAGAP